MPGGGRTVLSPHRQHASHVNRTCAKRSMSGSSSLTVGFPTALAGEAPAESRAPRRAGCLWAGGMPNPSCGRLPNQVPAERQSTASQIPAVADARFHQDLYCTIQFGRRHDSQSARPRSRSYAATFAGETQLHPLPARAHREARAGSLAASLASRAKVISPKTEMTVQRSGPARGTGSAKCQIPTTRAMNKRDLCTL